MRGERPPAQRVCLLVVTDLYRRRERPPLGLPQGLPQPMHMSGGARCAPLRTLRASSYAKRAPTHTRRKVLARPVAGPGWMADAAE
mmetsp:Transcript_12599/g.38560  ORF Transcript_12599/g.38560 Transcript_12599/m.38560 type:complete len:86 (+) Transcript_12599:348-605(+)